MKNPNKIKKAIIKLLKASHKQFYDEKGKECTVEEFADILFKKDIKDLEDFKRKLKR